MLIGSRRVRSAGRASGSIEITLPPELTALEGIVCTIMIRDGARPEIVLKPELSPSGLLFARVWARLRILLATAGEIGEFPAAEVDVCLLPPTSTAPANGGSGRPTLVYAYALMVGQALVPRWPVTTSEFSIQFPPGGINDTVQKALLGMVHPLGTVAGARLGLTGEMAGLFGYVVALLSIPLHCDATDAGALDGLPAATDARFEIAWSQHIWLATCNRNMQHLSVLAAQADDIQAQEALLRIISQFRDWQEHPERRQAARIEWLAQIPDWFSGVSHPLSTY